MNDLTLGAQDPCLQIYTGVDFPSGRPIVIDGNGHTISGTVPFGQLRIQNAIRVYPGYPGGNRVPTTQAEVIIQNVRIKGVESGITGETRSLTVSSSAITDARIGISATVSAATITQNTISGVQDGIVLSRSVNQPRIADNTISYSGQPGLGQGVGIRLFNSDGGVITDNDLTSINRQSRGPGIVMSGGSGNQITRNTVTRAANGIYLQGASGNTLRGNTVTYDVQAGILLSQRSNNNVIESNTLNYNVYGIALRTVSRDNRVVRNIAVDNRRAAVLLIESSTGNRLIGNIFCRNGAGSLEADPDSQPAQNSGTITNC